MVVRLLSRLKKVGLNCLFLQISKSNPLRVAVFYRNNLILLNEYGVSFYTAPGAIYTSLSDGLS